jgi:hypothetical protein
MRRAALAPFLVLFVSVSAQAQTATTLVGQVTGASGQPVAGATVTARHLESGLSRQAATDGAGAFTLPALPVGAYEVRVEAEGFRAQVRRGVVLALGPSQELRFVLQVGVPSEEVTVTADLPVLGTRSGELSYLVSEDAIENLPLNGRNYTDLAFLQPGVLAFPHRDTGSVVAHGMGASVNGQDPRANVYLLDGTLMNDFTNGPAGSAAGTTLGLETVREFRVEANAYGAEFGRAAGGQVNVITKSGTNDLHGSAWEFHRNDALDARNHFDTAGKPDFARNQFGATLGGPLRKDRTFFFVGYEGLREDLGRTISTVVPDRDARQGILPDPVRPGATLTVPVSPAVQPYLDAFPLPNGANLGGGLAAFSFPFEQQVDQDFFQARLDHAVSDRGQAFVRYTFDRADQRLPTDFPQFPRTFVSRNQFATGEYRHVISGSSMATVRLGWSRTRVGQEVEANLAGVAPFVPGRDLMGDIDIGGIPRFGPQSSVNVNLRQDVWSLAGDFTHGSGRHLLKAGLVAERYRDREFNPTFSLGIFTFPNLETFLRNRPQRFIGLTPEGDLDREWTFTFMGAYAQDEVRLARNLTVTGGLRYEFATLPAEAQGRDINLTDLLAPEVTVGDLYDNPGGSLSPRVGFAWDLTGDGRTAVRGGYGLYFNTNNQQNLIVTITNPPFTPRPVIINPVFPTPDFGRLGALSIRPMQFDLDTPRVHVWNVNVQRALPWRTVLTLGYAGTRGRHLLRNTDANTVAPVRQDDGTLVYPAGATRPNRSFSAIELKTSDGRSWYDALIVEVRRASATGLGFQASYTLARNEDTTQASTFFSDATNGTVSYFPEDGDPDYNRGRADFSARHNLVANLSWAIPLAREAAGLEKALLGNWRVSLIGQYRSGPPLTAFVQANRSRSLWSPSQGPGIGFDRPDLAPGRTPRDAVTGNPDAWFDPTAFVLQPAGRRGNHRRGSLTGPDLMVVDAALVKRVPFERIGPAGAVEVRVEAFNVFNRVNYGIPSLIAFAGQRDGEAPLTTFGRIRATTTPARQVQLGLRVVF